MRSEDTVAGGTVGRRSLRAMGSQATMIVVGADAEALADRAVARIEELEDRWSRFRAGSEINRLTAGAGGFVEVSAETRLLVECAVEGWRLTGGAFNPTVRGALVEAGYDRSFDAIGRPGPAADLFGGSIVECTDIVVGETAVRLPAGTGFDAGGIGKGLAADLVTDELLDAGAAGVCVNLGGDLRAEGTAPNGAWRIALEHPQHAEQIARLDLTRGAVATSTTARRRWVHDGAAAHHLLDPANGAPAETDLVQATVVAGRCWVAEVLAKAVLLRGRQRAFDLLHPSIHALVVGADGALAATDHLTDFLGGAPLPTRLPEGALS